MADKITLIEDDIIQEAGKQHFDGEGYNLMGIDAFVIGANIALQLKKENKSVLNPNFIIDGYNWAIEKFYTE